MSTESALRAAFNVLAFAAFNQWVYHPHNLFAAAVAWAGGILLLLMIDRAAHPPPLFPDDRRQGHRQ